jgi:hypothetical protein
VLFRRDASELRTADDVAALLARHFPPGSAAFEEDPAAADARDAEGA